MINDSPLELTCFFCNSSAAHTATSPIEEKYSCENCSVNYYYAFSKKYHQYMVTDLHAHIRINERKFNLICYFDSFFHTSFGRIDPLIISLILVENFGGSKFLQLKDQEAIEFLIQGLDKIKRQINKIINFA